MKPAVLLALFASVAVATPFVSFDDDNNNDDNDFDGDDDFDGEGDDVPVLEIPDDINTNTTIVPPANVTITPPSNNTLTPPPSNSTLLPDTVSPFTQETVFMTTLANGTTDYIRILNNSTVTTQSKRSCDSHAQALTIAMQGCKDYALKAKAVIEAAPEDLISKYFTKGDTAVRNKIATRYGLIAEECGRAGQGLLGTSCDPARCEVAGNQVAFGMSHVGTQAEAFYCPLFFSYYDMDEHILSNEPCLKRRDRMTHGAMVLMQAGFAAANLTFETGTRADDAYSYANFATIEASPCTATR